MADVTQTDVQNIPVDVDEPVLTVTPTAVNKIRGLMNERQLEGYALRVFVQALRLSAYSAVGLLRPLLKPHRRQRSTCRLCRTRPLLPCCLQTATRQLP